ncbi:MAG: hypothetical protein EOP49_29220 [Sphingobacteriales bacterium]|nr:MAG: hypothetical protein EOP49_29220 [Sphingobacteriales bacterium]
MIYLLTVIAALLFAAHVVLLLTSFRRSGFSSCRYFYSHVMLWLTGGCVFLLAWLYHGTGASGFLDYFSTWEHLLLIPGVTGILSLTAHLIVKFLILPTFIRRG